MIDIEKLIDEIHAQQAELRAAECDEPCLAPKASIWPRVAAIVAAALVGGAVWMGLLRQGSNIEENTILVAQHQAPRAVPQLSNSGPITPVASPGGKTQALPKHKRVSSTAATPIENPAHDQEPVPDQEPLLQLNSEADGLCLANNAEIDCDDISQLIVELLVI